MRGLDAWKSKERNIHRRKGTKRDQGRHYFHLLSDQGYIRLQKIIKKPGHRDRQATGAGPIQRIFERRSWENNQPLQSHERADAQQRRELDVSIIMKLQYHTIIFFSIAANQQEYPVFWLSLLKAPSFSLCPWWCYHGKPVLFYQETSDSFQQKDYDREPFRANSSREQQSDNMSSLWEY
jgi:hypothetical protein